MVIGHILTYFWRYSIFIKFHLVSIPILCVSVFAIPEELISIGIFLVTDELYSHRQNIIKRFKLSLSLDSHRFRLFNLQYGATLLLMILMWGFSAFSVLALLAYIDSPSSLRMAGIFLIDALIAIMLGFFFDDVGLESKLGNTVGKFIFISVFSMIYFLNINLKISIFLTILLTIFFRKRA